MVRLAIAFALCACGSDPGEPLAGTLAIVVDGVTTLPTVGAAIRDGDGAIVIAGTRDISCSTTIDDPLKAGTYVTMPIALETSAQMPFVSVIRVVTGGTLFNGGTGTVTVDGLGGRVTGSVMLTTIDSTEGGDITIEAAGTFDVARCF